MAYQDTHDIDSLFDDLRRGFFGAPAGWGGYGTPLLGTGGGIGQGLGGMRAPMVDVIDEGDRFVVTAELPGVRKEDIRLNVRGSVVRLHAERASSSETTDEGDLGERAERTLKGGSRSAGRSGGLATEPGLERRSYVRRERTQMVFDRTIRLPEEVRDDQAQARFANGVLTLTVPKVVPESGGGNVRIE